MSLDVYLVERGARARDSRSGIFVREDGAVKEITLDEWRERCPGRDPVVSIVNENTPDKEVYWRNITHNLGRMAGAADLYEALWRPDELGIERAHELVERLETGLVSLRATPSKFKAYNPENGWGDYEGLVEFVEDYLAACKRHPDARVSVSR